MTRFVVAALIVMLSAPVAAQASDIKVSDIKAGDIKAGDIKAGDIKAGVENIAAGVKVFRKCKACHVVDKEKNKTGPHLVGIIGRAAGSVEGFKKYSKAMKASGIVWNAETLDGYLESPKKYLKGGKMAFAGLKKKKDRDNIIAYFASLQ